MDLYGPDIGMILEDDCADTVMLMAARKIIQESDMEMGIHEKNGNSPYSRLEKLHYQKRIKN